MFKDEKSPGEINNPRLVKLYDLIKADKINPQRLFIIGKNYHLIFGKNHKEMGYFEEDYGIIVPKNFERGAILDAFSKIEFFIDELIKAKILANVNDERVESFEKILDKIDFYSKFKILSEDFLVIKKNGELYTKILLIKSVRDSIAHLWKIDNVYYKNPKKGLLKSNFEEFKNDLKEV